MEDITIHWWILKLPIIMLYLIIFILGLFGNILVLFIVFRNKSMQTITNIFITNLALSDILTTLVSVPFTPVSVYFAEWVLPIFLCRLLPWTMGVSIYVSTLTSSAIAIDRYIVIVHPFLSRMKMIVCVIVIVSIWLVGGLISSPNAIYITYNETLSSCTATWPSQSIQSSVSIGNLLLQFVVPVIIISFCYYKVISTLAERSRKKIGSGTKNRLREQAEIQRKKRTNTMLITMVIVFIGCWTPFNLFWLIYDYTNFISNNISVILYIFVHIIAMSGNIYNPILYGWFNRNFRLEFQRVLPFLQKIPFESKLKEDNENLPNENNTHFVRCSMVNNLNINQDNGDNGTIKENFHNYPPDNESNKVSKPLLSPEDIVISNDNCKTIKTQDDNC